MTFLKGCDISHFDPIPIKSFVGKMDFIIFKATQGASYKDNTFVSNRAQAKTTNLHVGAYHFLDINGTAQQQAQNYLSACQVAGLDFKSRWVLPPIIDVEVQVSPSGNQAETDKMNKWILDNKQKFIQFVSDWISIVEKLTGRTVCIYSYKSFFNEYLSDHSWPNNYLWLASYQKNEPGLPKGYSKYDFWQYTDHGKLTGETSGGNLDLDYFKGTIGQLEAL